jgi:hypothetical protein
MKVVLKPSILDEIYKRIRDAEMSHRKVDYILVTPQEYDDVRYQARPDLGLSPSSMPSDAKFQTIELDSPYQRYSKIRFASHDTLFGFPLYVVPPEYIPK